MIDYREAEELLHQAIKDGVRTRVVDGQLEVNQRDLRKWLRRNRDRSIAEILTNGKSQ
jgi:hypothetical protein